MGCLHKVFATEIDVELFREAERTRAASARSSWPARRCGAASSTSSARSSRTAEPCVNRRFFDWPDEAPDAVRAFDLRDRL